MPLAQVIAEIIKVPEITDKLKLITKYEVAGFSHC